MIFDLYAIRHKETGSFMPDVRGHQSEWDPPKVGDLIIVGYIPRLFPTYRSAANSLAAWLQGVWGRDTGTETDGWEHPVYTYLTEPMVMKAKPDRRREDMEIVEFELKLK
jgi:hypothetical protein